MITKSEIVNQANKPGCQIFVFVRLFATSFGDYIEISKEQLDGLLDGWLDDNYIELARMSKGNIYIGQN